MSTDREDVLKVFAGIGAAAALVFTALRHALDRQALALTGRTAVLSDERWRETLELSRPAAERTAALSEQAQVTDCYRKAIKQLGAPNRDVRLGGISGTRQSRDVGL